MKGVNFMKTYYFDKPDRKLRRQKTTSICLRAFRESESRTEIFFNNFFKGSENMKKNYNIS